MHDIPEELLRETLMRLLEQRGELASLCPSEVARAVSPGQWRPLMPAVRALAAALAAEGVLEVTQRGLVVDPRRAVGPIRLRRARRRPGPA